MNNKRHPNKKASYTPILQSPPRKERTPHEWGSDGDGTGPGKVEEGEREREEERREEAHQSSLVERLLASHGAHVPHHDPQLYRAAAALTRSIPGFSILAFPDFWGHLPPPGLERMAPRGPAVQRYRLSVCLSMSLRETSMYGRSI